MPNSQTRSLARRLDSLEKWRLQSKQPTLGFSTIEEGALQVVDEDETLRSTVGLQPDGTYTVVDVNGPPPPTPLEPTVDTQPGLLVVSSYGLTVDGSPWPLDFRRLDVHVSTTADFVPDLNTRVSEFSVEGGAVSLALPVGTYYVKLVAVSTSGTKSIPSAEVSRTVSPPATGAGGAALYRSDSPPVGLGPDDQAVWYDTDNGNLQSFWDGNSWEPMPLGPGATAEDVIAGKKVPLDSRVELAWGVPNPNAAPDFLYESLKPVWDPDTGLYVNSASYRGLVLDGTSLVQMQTVTDDATLLKSHRPMIISTTDGSVTYGPLLAELSATHLDTGVTPAQTRSSFPYILGMTKLGTTWYVLAHNMIFGSSYKARLFRYDSSWNFLSYSDVGSTGWIGCPYHGLTNDGTNLITTFDNDLFGAGSNPTIIEAHNPTTWATVSSVTITGTDLGTTGTYDPVDLLPLANYDFGAARYVVLARVGTFFPTFKAVVVDSTGAQQATSFPVKTGYLGNEITSIRWNATASQYEFGGSYGSIHQTTALASDINVWAGYTLYDSVADPDTHESALSPVTTSTTTVRKRHGLFVNGSIPTVDDDQAPDTIRVYARVGDATQPAPADMDLQTATLMGSSVNTNDPEHKTTVAMFIEQPVNGGAAPPPVSSFPEAPSGEIVSELGGMVVRGDGTIDSPFLTRLFDTRYDARYPPKAHTHDATDLRISVVDNRVNSVEADVAALDGRLDTVETDSTSMSAALTAIGARDGTFPTASSTASGSYTRTLDFVRIGNLVICSGEVDRASGFNSSVHDTGARVPVGFRPVANVVGPAMLGWASGTANYRYRVDAAAADLVTPSAVNIQQSAAIAAFQVAQLVWVTADPMP